MDITVLIPTYRRIADLERCLKALEKQTQAPAETLVIVRDTDDETTEFLQKFETNIITLRRVTVTIPGQVAALNAGLKAAQGDIIAITDDDAAPHSDWLERIKAHFLDDDQVGGVGGRDWVYYGTEPLKGSSYQVGKVQWFGRTINNHHLGVGTAREVDILKGANMSYRRAAIKDLQFDQRLRGSGAQVHNDLKFSLAVKKRGWKLIYDPAVAVDHFPANRFDEDQRSNFNNLACLNTAHNETIALLEYFSKQQRFIYLVWALCCGSRSTFGFVQCLRFLPSEGSLALQKLWVSMHGRWQGWQSWRQSSM